ncbi:KEOPS complex subunit Bud32 [uncultured archaeon]|nr:KEOPS complex subunit Bud32 [uncultured archaeon]
MVKILAQGAEAIIELEKGIVIKKRIPKSYRLKELDEKIRESRTRKETKILEKAHKIINVPEVLKKKEYEIDLEYIEGDKLAEKLNSYPLEKQLKVMENLGEEVAKLHANDIIHGDLTTSNTILKESKVFIIDFGLGFISKRTEDKAVDLHLIKQALEAKHFQNYEKLFHHFKEGYKKDFKEAEAVLERFKKVEARGRYKHAG